MSVRGPKQDHLKAVEQNNSRLRECIDEADRLCEAAKQLVQNEKDKGNSEPPDESPQA